MSSSTRWVPQETLDAWQLTEIEFAVVIAVLVFAVLCPATVCLVWCCLRPPPERDRSPRPKPPPAPAPEPSAAAEPAPVVLDMGADMLLAINGRPLVQGGKGLALPYAPDLSVIVSPGAAHVGAARAPAPGAADGEAGGEAGGAAFGVGDGYGGGADGPRFYASAGYAGALGPAFGAQKGDNGGDGGYAAEGEDSSWEADRIASLEHRVRVLEATLGAARASALAPLEHRTRGAPLAPAGRLAGVVVATPAHAPPAGCGAARVAARAAAPDASGPPAAAGSCGGGLRLSFDVA
ncbi:hypothetical protein KFE25_011618 [Diacronema lutheri]|uniref:Uncharacterized protein n=1 Tax=Diacronema lutheri TaxID=2081491 RepID=A0A8J5X960_DIALT|nr:hypothetical protein KFE25_011618 [Diacronema lutheri]